MPFRYSSPGATAFALVAAGVLSLFPTKRSSDHIRPALSPSTSDNTDIEELKKVVAEHDGCTAEVINLNVFGRKRVETFRLLSPGRKVELRMKKGDIKVFAYGEYISELIVSPDSNLPRLFNENIAFDAYLGGREQVFMCDDTYDSCAIIVFYKIKGIPPTKVNVM